MTTLPKIFLLLFLISIAGTNAGRVSRTRKGTLSRLMQRRCDRIMKECQAYTTNVDDDDAVVTDSDVDGDAAADQNELGQLVERVDVTDVETKSIIDQEPVVSGVITNIGPSYDREPVTAGR